MRRFIAILLAALFGALLIVPAFASSIKPPLLACCRKDGKHHCTMQEVGHTSEPAVAAIRDKCPFFPHTSVVGQYGIDTVIPAAAIFAGWLSHPSGSPQTEAVYRISYQRSHQKRGPPSVPVLS